MMNDGNCTKCGKYAGDCICPDGVASGSAEAPWLGCGVCGGKLVEIRGIHPSDKPRQVCPTCLAERMDMIREMSAADYGMAYEAHPNEKLTQDARP